MKSIILALFCIPLLLSAQQEGIHFESGLTWKQIKAKAKTENKYIFIDCYATWCGPCKWMSKNIFPDPEVGEFYNSHFICVAVQMDRTPGDSEPVRSWYSDADSISERYGIHAFPAYLFFSPDGQIVHRFIGATADKMEFISKGKDALNPDKQYYTILEACQSHKEDSVFLKNALTSALHQDDAENAFMIGEYYLDCLKEPTSKENIKIISLLISSGKRKFEKGYRIFVDSAQKIDRLMGDSLYVERTIAPFILQEVIGSLQLKDGSPLYWKKIRTDLRVNYPTLSPGIIYLEETLFKGYIEEDIKKSLSNLTEVPDNWNMILKQFRHKYPDFEINPILLKRKTKYYAAKKMWFSCVNAAYDWIHGYGDQLDDFDKNNILWEYIFMHSTDKKMLEEALKWSKMIVQVKPGEPITIDHANYLDTYANLLYKLGNRKEALVAENEAIEIQNNFIAKENIIQNKRYFQYQLEEFKANLDKMQKNQPTWPDSKQSS